MHLLCLTLMACHNVPLDVFDDMQPQKVKHEAHSRGVDSFQVMSKVVVHFFKNVIAFVRLHY